MWIKDVLVTTAALTVIIGLRYLLVAWMVHALVWRKNGRVAGRRLNRDAPRPAVMRHELKLSLLSSWIYALPAALALGVFKHGGTLMYLDPGKYGWWWLPVSGLIYLLVQDAYYYWLHRLMHHKALFKWMHAGHHRSRQPTAYASFSFDGVEAVLNAWLLPAMVFFVPVHPAVLLTLLSVATAAAVMNHCGSELLPPAFVRGPVGGWIISATHHSGHHTQLRSNYGLYFRFWDRLMKTEVMPDDAPLPAPAKAA